MTCSRAFAAASAQASAEGPSDGDGVVRGWRVRRRLAVARITRVPVDGTGIDIGLQKKPLGCRVPV